jgi:tripartite-type tricarboxylate transporter receptor subunit TctC
MPSISKLTRAAALAATVVGCAGSAFAAPAGCPDRYMRMVIPQPAGGVGDLIGRVLGEKVAAILGQQVVIDNRPGGTTTIGTAAVATAKADGCTILNLTTSGVVASVMRDNLPYKLERDFAPVIGVGSFPMTLAVQASSKIRSLGDFAAASKSGDGLNYSSGGPGTLAHLSSLRLLKEIGGKGTHVPYKGNAYAIQGLLGGEVQFMFPSTAEALPLVQGGKLRVLGLTADQRLPVFPDVPTMKELGFADFTPKIWYAFLVPSGTPADTVTRLHDAFAQAVRDPVVQQKLNGLGFTPEVRTGAEVAAFMKSEAGRWKKVVQDNNVTNQD